MKWFMKKNIILISVLSLLLSACTSVKIDPVSKSEKISHVCIQNNPKVTIGNFVPVIKAEMQNIGISSEVFHSTTTPKNCEYVMQYTALRSWDVTTYLSHAELFLYKNNAKIASAIYHLKGKGGFDFSKWRSVKSKMTPVVRQLFND